MSNVNSVKFPTFVVECWLVKSWEPFENVKFVDWLSGLLFVRFLWLILMNLKMLISFCYFNLFIFIVGVIPYLLWKKLLVIGVRESLTFWTNFLIERGPWLPSTYSSNKKKNIEVGLKLSYIIIIIIIKYCFILNKNEWNLISKFILINYHFDCVTTCPKC